MCVQKPETEDPSDLSPMIYELNDLSLPHRRQVKCRLRDNPRPPKLMYDIRLVEVYQGQQVVTKSDSTYRALEIASPSSF